VLKFINYLCDISYKLEEATTDKLECLTQELSKINGLLPTNAYIPFIKERIRHRVILHIPESESHIFSTKSRNPYLIACELYDPLELIPDMKEFISYQKPLVFNPTNNIMEYYNKITQHIISTPYTVSFPKTVSTTVRKKSRNSIGSNIKVTDFSEAAVLFRQASIVPAIEFSELYSGNNKEIKSIEKFDPFGESFEEQSARIRKSSPYGNLKSWKLVKLIVKTNDNLIQEQFAMQLILQIKQIFDEENTNLWIYPYEIVCTGVDRGIIECINDIITLDSLKKKLNKIGIKALRDFFALYFKFQDKAKTCFASSLASYSLICYILRIKDRHNANIMIDKFGHLIHIDFGFMISNSPGNLDVDNTPFKLPQEWVDVIGTAGPFFDIFREGMINGFMAIQKHYPKIQILVEAMYNLYEDLPCFKEKQKAIEAISNRLFPVIKGRNHKRAMNRQEAAAYIDAYIDYLGLFPHQTTALELGHMICINTVAKEYIRYVEINFL
jgi:phosphatidylinositol 4-kinase